MPGQEPRFYTASEKVKLAALVARAAVCVQRGRSTVAVERDIERVQAEAVAREQAELAAADAARQKRVQDRAARSASRRWF